MSIKRKMLSQKGIYGPLTQKTLKNLLKKELITTFDFDEDALGVGAAILAETAKLAIDSLAKQSAGPTSTI